MWPSHTMALLGFWQFGNAGMLLWGLAAAVPLLIHLWSRRKYRQEPWAAMAFLLAALKTSARRIQLQQWTLLAVRMAILLLFALALADPQRAGSTSAAGTSGLGAPEHIVLVIDNSYSMDYHQGDISRFAAAKEFAKELVRNQEQGTGYSLVLMGSAEGGPQVVISEPAYDPGQVLEELESLQIRHGAANLPATLAEVEAILRKAGDRPAGGGRAVRRRVCFLTDLQQATWSEVNSAACAASFSRLEKLASLELIDFGRTGEPNFAVTDVAIGSGGAGVVAAMSDVQIQADLQSFAEDYRPGLTAKVLVDGQLVADERLNLPSRGRAAISATHRFNTPGDHIVEVHLADDPLLLDNRRWLSLAVRDVIRVLAIGGRPGATRHAALALAPSRQTAAPIEVTEATESRLIEGDLARFDCLVLCNIRQFSRDEEALLHDYVVGGGGLIVFLGDQVQAENYNGLLVADPLRRVLPAQLNETAPTAVEGYPLDPLDYRHAIAAPFRGFEEAGLLTTPVWKYVRLTPVEGAVTAVAFSNGDPAIVESRAGRGRCIIVATAASPDSLDRSTDPPVPWTAAPSWPSFPPLMHEMLRFVIAGQSEERNLVVGDELMGDLPAGIDRQSVTLSGPGLPAVRLPLVGGGDSPRKWSYGPAPVSGVYEARLGDEVRRIAVNVDPRESDLARFNPAMLPRQLRRGPPDAVDEGPVRAAGQRTSYFRWLLAAVLALLIVDPCLAWHFGRGRG